MGRLGADVFEIRQVHVHGALVGANGLHRLVAGGVPHNGQVQAALSRTPQHLAHLGAVMGGGHHVDVEGPLPLAARKNPSASWSIAQGFPASPAAKRPFWQYTQPREQWPKNTVPLPSVPLMGGSSQKCSAMRPTSTWSEAPAEPPLARSPVRSAAARALPAAGQPGGYISWKSSRR